MKKKLLFIPIALLVILLIILLSIEFKNINEKKGFYDAAVTVVPLNSNFSDLRIENEAKLVVPQDQIEIVWTYLLNELVTDQTYIKSLDAGFNSYWYDEVFTDEYFDTPDLYLLAHESSIRHRLRFNLTDPEAEKNGRELVQIKINDISSNDQSRGELKFDIRDDGKTDDTDDLQPLIGLIKDSDRDDFKDVMSQINVDPYELQKILTLQQHRRSIYITYNGDPFMSIRFDEVTSKMLWANYSHCEIEIELNEIPYTEGDEVQRESMESVKQEIMSHILQEFPDIALDLTPKYNKAFNYFDAEIPWFRIIIKLGAIK
jgi:hypothetical protein